MNDFEIDSDGKGKWGVKRPDLFYGNGFVVGDDVPAPKCINDVFWYEATEQESLSQFDNLSEGNYNGQ